MKTLVLLILAQVITVYSLAQVNFWENPSIVNEGKEPPRAHFIPFTSKSEFLEGSLQTSSRVQSLNGTWKFNFVERVADRPKNFYLKDLDHSQWPDIQVPSSWEVQGFGVPVYANVSYFFPTNPPYLNSDDLPIGTYRKLFRVDDRFLGKEIILHFASIAGAATIYVNEQRVGYSKAAKTPAEFNITPFLKSGDNLIAVQIFKWSDASYIEGQDFWRLAGIHRYVYLIARPKVSIEDFFVVANLDDAYRHGIFSMDVDVRNFEATPSKQHTVDVTLLDAQGKRVLSKKLDVKPIEAGGVQTVSFQQRVSRPLQWSAEHPNLYRVVVELRNHEGATLEVTGCYTGFRRIEIKGKQVLINGKPIIIRGVNTHEHHERYGRYVDPATRLEDIRLMKLHNLNAVRTSHYPQSPDFNALADKHGIYLVNEANIEAHGLDGFDRSRHPAFSEKWLGQLMDRTIRMFERDKNNPSVIIWSLGNETDFGPNFEATFNWLKTNDRAKRPVKFERSFENEFTDIVTPMYAFPECVERYGRDPSKTRPYILCEYAHSMGNSTGNLQEYWDIIMRYPILQGGFIWDWVDQGLETFTTLGEKYWAYGGDLGGHRWPHDENFSNNGLVRPDRSIQPAIMEVKKVYQPIWFRAADIERGVINFHNYNLFTDLNEYDYRWRLYENGKVIASSTFTAQGKPLEVTPVQLRIPPRNYQPGSEFFLVVEALQRVPTEFVPKGHVVANEQFAFPGNNFFVHTQPEGNLKVRKTDREIHFESGDTRGVINLRYGTLSGYSHKGNRLITHAPRPHLWRAPIDNDFGNNMPRRLNIWRAFADNLILESINVGELDSTGLVVEANFRFLGLDVFHSVRYHIRNDASVMVTSSFDMSQQPLPELPRFGMTMQLPMEFTNATYYGRGPWENYSDRSTAAFIGLYQSKVEDFTFNYSRPQENGYRTGVRWVAFTNDQGYGVAFEGIDQPIGFNARYNFCEDYDPGFTKKQQQPIDVHRRHTLVVNIDHKQMGVGGNNSWGAHPMDKYRLLEHTYHYSYVIRPVEQSSVQ